MENKESIYSEVIIDFYDDIKNEWTIDTWKTDNDNEEGVVVARINLKGEILWEVEDAKNDPRVKKEIEYFMDNRLFSVKDSDKIADELFKVFKSPYRGSRERMDIINPDGVTAYGYDKIEILENDVIAAGMIGEENFKVTSNCSDEEIKNLIDWLLEDIESAVGEEYVIEFD